jgi:hypothetical protein
VASVAIIRLQSCLRGFQKLRMRWPVFRDSVAFRRVSKGEREVEVAV